MRAKLIYKYTQKLQKLIKSATKNHEINEIYKYLQKLYFFWKSTKPGHNVEFIKGGVPEGVGKFRSALSKDTEYKFEIPGIYAYWCTPHKGMGMIGFVLVGNDKSNLEAIKTIRYSGKSKKIAPDLINTL